MRRLLIAMVLAAYSAVCGCVDQCNPHRVVGFNRYNPIIYRWVNENHVQTFVDQRPFRSLDAVVVYDKQTGEEISLEPGESGFEEYDKKFKEHILPLYTD